MEPADVKETARYACPCCGYLTLSQPPPGTYDICAICDWDDDQVQYDDPDYEGGANGRSLRQWQRKFLSLKLYGMEPNWGRAVRATDVRDPNWKPLP